MSTEDVKKLFEKCIVECERELYGYIFGLIPNHADAKDILQDTTVRLWSNFDKYDRSLPFGPWARKFAHTQVLKAIEKGKYRKWMTHPFSEEAVSMLETEYECHSGVLNLRKQALVQCLTKLDAPAVELLKKRYWSDSNLRQMANNDGVPEHSIYRRLAKIRVLLQKCIDQQLALVK